jgi:hypothetical protein
MSGSFDIHDPFHQTLSAMMTTPPNDMHALQCCQIRITKSDQLLIKSLAIILISDGTFADARKNQADNPLPRVIHILQKPVDRPSLE